MFYTFLRLSPVGGSDRCRVHNETLTGIVSNRRSQMDDATVGIMAGLFGGVFMLVWLAVVVVSIASLWKLYIKAGQPGWAGIVPIYNIIVLLTIVGRPIWWIALFCVPFVNIIVLIIVFIDLAKSFGKDLGFAIGMILLSIIFLPMLAFGDSQYVGPSAGGAAPPPAA